MFQNAVYLKWQLRHVLNLFGHYSHLLTDMTYLNKRFITIIDQFGNKKKIRTEAEKARRRAEEQAQKVYKEKKCIHCLEIYLPFRYAFLDFANC